MQMTAQVGALDPYATDEVFRRLEPAVSRCLAEGAERVAPLGGEFTLALRIRLDGSIEAAYMAASTLGSRATERCILDAARASEWPQPLGGVAEAEHGFGVDPAVPVGELDERKVRSVMIRMRQKLARCLPRFGARYQATLYIGRDGRVISAGVAPPDPEAEAKADCVAEVLESFRFGPQRERFTKVSFSFR